MPQEEPIAQEKLFFKLPHSHYRIMFMYLYFGVHIDMSAK